jgi:YesN/AraC family two-component response regulator
MPRILIVDDDKLIRELLQQILEREGYETNTAINGNDAITKFNEYKPHLVVTDIIMPEKEGLELIQIFIKKDPFIKIMAISGGAYYNDIRDVLKMAEILGAHATLSKPLTKSEFINEVKKLV